VPKVHRSTVIDAPVDEVWRLLRDFNGHQRWHPAVAASRIEDGRAGDEVGAVRRFRLRDGAELREQLLRLSDRDRSFTYCLLESPIPLLGYVATVRLRPVTDGNRTFWDWRSSFAAPPGQEAELAALVGEEIYEAGFAAVRELVAGGRVARPARRPAVAAGAGRGPITAHAIVLDRHGGPEELEWRRVEVPPPGPGEVRLRQTAVGLNYLDVYSRTGEAALLAAGDARRGGRRGGRGRGRGGGRDPARRPGGLRLSSRRRLCRVPDPAGRPRPRAAGGDR
jgi:hypothetical protein